MKRWLPLLMLLLWPAWATAQITSPGGGNVSSGTITGGSCTNPQFVQALSTSGVPTCATPAGGGALPTGNAGQFVGYPATGTTGEAETLGGDATMARTGANAYSLTVTKTSGTAFTALATATVPLSVANGGAGNGTAPSAGQIRIAQSATSFTPQTLSQDCTITSAGVMTCTKTNNVAFTALATAAVPLSIANGGLGQSTAPSAGMIDVAQSATVISPVAMSGDCTIVSTGAMTCTKLHFGAANLVNLPAVAPTSGGIPYFSSTTALASSALLTLNTPVLGGGAGGAPTSGTVSGNTTKFVTTTGTLTSGDVGSWDASGNLIDGGALPAVTTGSWTPTLTSSGATFTYTTQSGGYYQVGKIIYASFQILLATATGTSGNNTTISGLPCTAAASSGGFLAWPVSNVTGVANQAMGYFLDNGGAYIKLGMVSVTSGTIFTNPFASNQLAGTANFQGSVVYRCT